MSQNSWFSIFNRKSPKKKGNSGSEKDIRTLSFVGSPPPTNTLTNEDLFRAHRCQSVLSRWSSLPRVPSPSTDFPSPEQRYATIRRKKPSQLIEFKYDQLYGIFPDNDDDDIESVYSLPLPNRAMNSSCNKIDKFGRTISGMMRFTSIASSINSKASTMPRQASNFGSVMEFDPFAFLTHYESYEVEPESNAFVREEHYFLPSRWNDKASQNLRKLEESGDYNQFLPYDEKDDLKQRPKSLIKSIACNKKSGHFPYSEDHFWF